MKKTTTKKNKTNAKKTTTVLKTIKKKKVIEKKSVTTSMPVSLYKKIVKLAKKNKTSVSKQLLELTLKAI